MKKHLSFAFAALVCGLATFTSCSREDNTVNYPYHRVLTFEDSDWKGGLNYIGQANWSSLIDTPQNMGPLLYPTAPDAQIYQWADMGNTLFMTELLNTWGDKAFWGGGIAVSNYVDSDLSHGDADHQLSVPVSNGSKNFAVVYCNSNPTIDPKNPQVGMVFADVTPRVVKSIDVAPTTYQLNVAKNGNGWAKALTEAGDYLTLTIHGVVGESITNSIKVDMARDGQFLTKWKTVDLTALGAVQALMFTMETNDSYYGYANQPTYFAFDNVTVKF